MSRNQRNGYQQKKFSHGWVISRICKDLRYSVPEQAPGTCTSVFSSLEELQRSPDVENDKAI